MTPFPVPQSIEDYVKLLEDGVPFTHANIGGDGEFLAIVGATGVNSDGRTYNPEKGAELAKVLLEPRLTLHGYNPGGHHKSGAPNVKRKNAEDWLKAHGVNVPVQTPGTLTDPDFGTSRINVRWVHKEIISSANANGRLGPFLRALRTRCLIVVGPRTLTDDFVFRTLNADDAALTSYGWDAMDALEEIVRHKADQLDLSGVLTWSLGYLSKVLAWRIAPDYPHLTQIDMGACWESYCGVHSRHGYKKPEWPDLMRKNLREAGIG